MTLNRPEDSLISIENNTGKNIELTKPQKTSQLNFNKSLEIFSFVTALEK